MRTDAGQATVSCGTEKEPVTIGARKAHESLPFSMGLVEQ
jgi:hypothetical protein